MGMEIAKRAVRLTKRVDEMRKYLIAFVVLALLILGAVWWLGQKAEQAVPEAGEQRLEIENVFQ